MFVITAQTAQNTKGEMTRQDITENIALLAKLCCFGYRTFSQTHIYSTLDKCLGVLKKRARKEKQHGTKKGQSI
ncbi:MAG TPA: hypothetical protein DC053_21465 [Lachnoclostridium sp.]|nr:hypothetical protein [Lachnoclostridium sp.]